MTERYINLNLDPELAFDIAELAREFANEDFLAGNTAIDRKVDDPGDDAILSDEQLLTAAEHHQDDAIESELRTALDGLNIDAQRDILALLWIGRGDFDAAEWSGARRQARHTRHLHLADYLEQTPLASDYLAEGLNLLGFMQGEPDEDEAS